MNRIKHALLMAVTIFIVMTLLNFLIDKEIENNELIVNSVTGLVTGFLAAFVFNSSKK